VWAFALVMLAVNATGTCSASRSRKALWSARHRVTVLGAMASRSPARRRPARFTSARQPGHAFKATSADSALLRLLVVVGFRVDGDVRRGVRDPEDHPQATMITSGASASSTSSCLDGPSSATARRRPEGRVLREPARALLNPTEHSSPLAVRSCRADDHRLARLRMAFTQLRSRYMYALCREACSQAEDTIGRTHASTAPAHRGPGADV